MGDSSNLYLEQQNGSSQQFPKLSQKELESLSRQFHDQAQEELELAIRLNPNDPTPYYVFCNSQFLDFSQLKNQYLQGVQRDTTHSPEFGGKHWSFAIKAAKFGQGNETTSAFLRAMIVAPEEYYEGPRSVRPKDGLALSCWQTAKQQIVSYRDDSGKLDKLWLVDQTVENVSVPQLVNEKLSNVGSLQSFLERFTQQEWETLQLAFIWVFRATIGVIRKSDCLKLDEKTMSMLGMVIARAPELENDLAREVMMSLAGDFEDLWMRCLDDPRLPHEALGPVAQLLQDRVSLEDAQGYKQAILIMIRVVAETSGHEAAAIVMPAVLLYPNASTDEILSEVGMTTSRNIYKQPSDSSIDQAASSQPPQKELESSRYSTLNVAPSVAQPPSATENAPTLIVASNKSPMLATALSFFLFGGAGQIYLGQWKKGLALILATWLLSGVVVGIPIAIIGVGDAYGTAKKLSAGNPVGEWEFNVNWKVVGLVVIICVIAICGITSLAMLIPSR
jgi:TM2 domain-containing membrane protein YozV